MFRKKFIKHDMGMPDPVLIFQKEFEDKTGCLLSYDEAREQVQNDVSVDDYIEASIKEAEAFFKRNQHMLNTIML